MTAACAGAHRQGLEFIADFKTFDIGMNCITTPATVPQEFGVEKLDRAVFRRHPRNRRGPGRDVASEPGVEAASRTCP